MKRLAGAGALLVLAIGVFLLGIREESDSLIALEADLPSATVDGSADSAQELSDLLTPGIAVAPADEAPAGFHPLAERLHRPAGSNVEDLQTIESMLSDLRNADRSLAFRPLGTNREFTAVLLGDNQFRLASLRSGHPAVNETGQLVDRWGTPYFFHPLSATQTEIRSAGPDRELFTEDDEVVGQRPLEERP